MSRHQEIERIRMRHAVLCIPPGSDDDAWLKAETVDLLVYLDDVRELLAEIDDLRASHPRTVPENVAKEADRDSW
jgi:hypothetical protein